MNAVETKDYLRITKSQARKRYMNGGTIYLLPCRMNPDNHAQAPMLVRLHRYGNETGRPDFSDQNSFDTVVNAFEYYNCDKERGYYTAFYSKK